MKGFVEGYPTPGPTPESVRLFALCSAMDWAVLPNAGGLYDQHPQLIEEWQAIFEAQHDKRERDERNRKTPQRGSLRR